MKFLEDPYQTLGVGLALTIVLVGLFAVGLGTTDSDWIGLLGRWVHFLAGIMWIGLLYFFNLINAAFLKSLDGPVKNVVIPKLMPTSLNWFRHGATVTVLAGLFLYVYHQHYKMGAGGIAVSIGGLLGLIMLANVHAIIWPNQKRIIAAVEKTAKDGTPAPPEMAAWARKALLASRVNFMLSIPMLFFMGAGAHLK